MIDFIVEYWLEWLFGIITLAIGIGARQYLKLQREAWQTKWDTREKEMRKEIVDKLETEIKAEDEAFKAADKKIYAEMEIISNNVENATIGILSIQAKQFREQCYRLLDPGHIITIDEYEQHCIDYDAYKALGGNHRGDALHKSVIAKWEASFK